MMYVLTLAGLSGVMIKVPELRGTQPENICNRCKSGKGVQLEISRGLREKCLLLYLKIFTNITLTLISQFAWLTESLAESGIIESGPLCNGCSENHLT